MNYTSTFLSRTDTDRETDYLTVGLWTLVIAGVTGDYLTTIVGLEMLAMAESNPYVLLMLETGGYVLFWLVKLSLLAVVYVVTVTSSRLLGHSALLGFGLPHAYAVVSNSLLIAGAV